MGIRRKGNQRSRRQFVIHNWDEVHVLNPMAVPDLDAAKAGAGAIPIVLEDTPSGVL